jgi:hypothetical protein
MIDLRSDTCSRPTEAMRRAMAEAAVIGISEDHMDKPQRESCSLPSSSVSSFHTHRQ